MSLLSRLFKREGESSAEGDQQAEQKGSGEADATPAPAQQAPPPPDANQRPSTPGQPRRSRSGRPPDKKVADPLAPLELDDLDLPSKKRDKTPRPRRSSRPPVAEDANAAPAPASRRGRSRRPPASPQAQASAIPKTRAAVIPPAAEVVPPPAAPPRPGAKSAAVARPPLKAPAPKLPNAPAPKPPKAPAPKPSPPVAGKAAPAPAAPPPSPEPPPEAPVTETAAPAVAAAAGALPVAEAAPAAPVTAAAAAPPKTAPKPAAPPEVNPDDLFDDDIDRMFEEARLRTSRPPPSRRSSRPDQVTTAEDLKGVQDLFNQLAVHYVGQLRDFMLELRRADAATTWIPLCEPAVQKLRAMCGMLAMPELSSALEAFAASLQRAKENARSLVRGEQREDLLRCYDEMTALLPKAFELSEGREAILVQLLLMQVPGVRQLTVEKLYRAGLHQFDSFFRGAPEEVAAVAGIELELAQKIAQRFRDYRHNVTAVLAAPIPAHERTRLAELLERLREQNDAFERAAAGWTSDALADKKRLRRERTRTLSDIYVALTRLGEVDRVNALQKLPVGRQLDEVEDYLQHVRGMAPPM